MAIKLNIQLFADIEGGLNPSAFNNLVSQYESDMPNVNRAFTTNQDALQILKNVAGSPRLSENTRSAVSALNSAIEETANYFDSVKNWTESVVSAVSSIFGSVGLGSVSASVDRTVLDQINENFDGGFVGIKNFSDVDTYISSVQNDVIPTLRNGLESITNDVAEADGSLPAEVHNALGSTISKNNDDVLAGYDQMSRMLTDNLDSFKVEVQNAVSDMAAAAGGNQ